MVDAENVLTDAGPHFLRFPPVTPEQTAELRRRLDRLREPAFLVPLLRRADPGLPPVRAVSATPLRCKRDRFVLRAQVNGSDGRERSYAIKGYVDDRGRRVAAVCRSLAQAARGNPIGICVPLAYLSDTRILVSPWIDGSSLADEIKAGRLDRLDAAAALLARLHRSGVVPEGETSAESIVERTLERCARLCKHWPELGPAMQPLMTALEQATPSVPRSPPALVHGDPAPDQFIWRESRVTLLDMDMFGYTDPAYDVGQFMTELLRWSLDRPEVAPSFPALQCRFFAAYSDATPEVDEKTVWFFHGLTLLRRIIYVVRTERPDDTHRVVAALAESAADCLQRAVA